MVLSQLKVMEKCNLLHTSILNQTKVQTVKDLTFLNEDLKTLEET